MGASIAADNGALPHHNSLYATSTSAIIYSACSTMNTCGQCVVMSCCKSRGVCDYHHDSSNNDVQHRQCSMCDSFIPPIRVQRALNDCGLSRNIWGQVI